ncbi:MAG: BatA domain-containing protein [Planctomycetes bacterium]|nr:BatA domain-containing protein [Planctomycetota bacterium]
MPPAAVPFINPAFLWAGMGLALIPIVIYILNRRRYRTVAWAAMRFLLAANRKTIRRTRLEQLLLMALRITLLVLLGLAMGRPFLQSGAAPAVFAERTHHIFVLDDSFSMSATIDPHESGEPTRRAFDMQIELAYRLLQDLPTRDPVSLFWMGYPARQVNRKPIFDRALAGRLLKTAKPGHGHSDLIGALRRVRDLIASLREEHPRHTVYVFSDFAKPTLQPAEAPALSTQHSALSSQHSALSTQHSALSTQHSVPSPLESLKSLAHEITRSASLVLHDVCDHDTPNLANTYLAPQTNLVGAGEVAEIVNTITNLAARRSAECKVRIAVDGKEVREFTIEPLEAGASQSLSFAIEFELPGLHTIQSTLLAKSNERALPGDVLKLDNTRLVVVEAREQVPILIVDGKPGATRLRGHAGYLNVALAPALAPAPDRQVDPGSTAADLSGLAPTIIAEDELASRDLSSVDVVALCNVKRLGEDTWQRLEGFVHNGGGLLLFLGDLVDLEHYNSAAQALLPCRLIEPAFVEVSESNFVNFAAGTLAEPLKTDFEGRPESGLFRAHVHQYIKMATALDTGRTLIRYTSGDPAIAERRIGAGKCVLVSTTANMAWTNLPAKGDFITLVMNLVQHVAPAGAANRNFTVGDSFIEDIAVISAGGEEYLIHRPDGTAARLAIEASRGFEAPRGSDGRAGGFRVRFDHLDRAGAYRLHMPGVEDPMIVNLNPLESDLTPLTEDEIRQAFDCDLEYIVARATDAEWVGGGRSEFASMMVYAVLLLLLSETLLAMWFDHERHEERLRAPGFKGSTRSLKPEA